MMNEKEINFIDDPNFKERKYLLNKIDTIVDSAGYRKKLFLKKFIFEIIKTFRDKNKPKLPEIKLEIEPVPKKPIIEFVKPIYQEIKKIQPMTLGKPIVLSIPETKQAYPLKTYPYPKPTPLHQLKPLIKRRLANKKLPFLKPKDKNIYMEGGKIYYLAKINEKTYLDQVKSILADTGVNGIYCDGINKPLLVDYLNYSQLLTRIKFSDKNRLNNMLKKFAEEGGVRFSKDKPVLLENLRNSLIFQANLGSDIVDPKFIIKKGKLL